MNQASNDFESTINTAYFDFDYTAYLGDKNLWTGGVTSSGTYGLVEDRFYKPLTTILSSPAYEVGIIFGNDQVCFNAILNIYDENDNLLGGVSIVTNYNDWADQFIGLYSDQAFSRVDIYYDSPYLSVFIDDFTTGFDAKVVPIPAAVWLLGTGLLGLIGFKRWSFFRKN